MCEHVSYEVWVYQALPSLWCVRLYDVKCGPWGALSAATGPQVWNSLPPNLRLCGLSIIRPVQAVIEDIFIRIVKPRRSMNCL